MSLNATKVLSRDQLKDSIAVIVGTRPGIIKFAPVIRELQQRRINYYILHTGQHYSYNMDKKFFDREINSLERLKRVCFELKEFSDLLEGSFSNRVKKNFNVWVKKQLAQRH